MKAVTVLFSLALISPAMGTPAHGAEKKADCREGKSFVGEIYNCGQNKIAADYAEKCSGSLLTASQSASAVLAAEMAALNKQLGSSQTAHMQEAKSRLGMAVATLGAQIAVLQKNTAMIADYPKVMIDYPGAEDDETSAGCFSPAFNKIQDIVSNLDREIVSAKKAREQAIVFLQTLGMNAGDMTTVGGGALPAASDAPARAAPQGPKGKRWNASDISGTEPKDKK